MTKFGGKVDRATAFALRARDVGRLLNLDDRGVAFIGFSKREMKRRDVAPLVSGQQIQDICTDFQPVWFQTRTWFEIGGLITEPENDEVKRNWEARFGADKPASS